MSENGKIIEFKGTKYYLEEDQLYKLVPIGRVKVPVDIKKLKKCIQISLPQENLLDVFKFLDFNQLLSFQQTSFYFKNIIDKYGKELARKKFSTLRFLPFNDFNFAECKFEVEPHLHKFEKQLKEKRFVKPNFVEIQPYLYDFELSRQLEQKWIHGIEEQMPTFLTSSHIQYRDIDTVICELEQNYNGKVLYLIKLPKFPKNLEQMAIARYLFKLLFNCVFEYFEIHQVLFNPQMIDLLFDVENETTNFPLQVHSQNTKLPFLWNNDPCFVWNHLVSNRLRVDMHAYDTEYLFNDNVQDIDIFNDLTQGPTSRFRTFVFGLYKMLTEGGNKFLNITCTHLDSRLYNLIIKHLETSQKITQMVKEIKFEHMCGLRNSSEGAENVKIQAYKKLKFTDFQLVNNYNPKIKFSVLIDENEDKYINLQGTRLPYFDAVIKRID